MVGVNTHKKRMIFFEHRAKIGGDPLGEEERNARTNAQKLHMRNGSQAMQQELQLLVTEQERVASAQEHIANSGVLPDIVELPIELGMKVIPGGVADQPGAS